MPSSVAVPLILVVLAASAFPWLLVLRARLGHRIAIPAVSAGALLSLLFVLVISRLLHTDYRAALIVAAIITGVVGVLVAVRTPTALRPPGRYAIALWCPALLGAAVWAVTTAIAQFVPGASRFGWTMNGDALNNLYYGNLIAHSNGLALGATQNPVPLPASLIALAIGAGSPSSATTAASLTHELSAFTLVWVLMLGATCVATGAVVASAIPPRLTRTVAVASGLGSLLPLTWLVSGLTIQWGYFNVDTLLPIIFASWLVFLGSRTHPVAALVTLAGLATLTLATWTPCVVVIAALGVAVVVRNARRFRMVRGWPLAAIIVAISQAVAFVAVETIPTFLVQQKSLAYGGFGGFGFPNMWWGVPIIGLLLVATLLAIRRRSDAPFVAATVALVIGGALASAMLLYFARSQQDVFGAYYPKKLAWSFLVVGGTIALSFALAALAGRVRTSLFAVVACLGLFAASVVPPGTWPETVQRQPVVRILGDFVRHGGETTTNHIIRFTDARHPTVLWQSGNPDEPIINEWLLLRDGGFVHGNKQLIHAVGVPYFLYRASGRYGDTHIQTLCALLPLIHPAATVRTANPKVQAELDATCPGLAAGVVVDPSLAGPRPARTGQNWISDGIQ